MVKLGICKENGESVAIKIVDKSCVKKKPEMLTNEIEILKRVDHPNIIKLKDLFETPTTLYLVMELYCSLIFIHSHSFLSSSSLRSGLTLLIGGVFSSQSSWW